MTDIEEDLRRVLTVRVAEFDSHLTGAHIRDLAQQRRHNFSRGVALPAAAGALLTMAALVAPLALTHGRDAPQQPQRPTGVVSPAGSSHARPMAPSATPTPRSPARCGPTTSNAPARTGETVGTLPRPPSATPTTEASPLAPTRSSSTRSAPIASLPTPTGPTASHPGAPVSSAASATAGSGDTCDR